VPEASDELALLSDSSDAAGQAPGAAIDESDVVLMEAVEQDPPPPKPVFTPPKPREPKGEAKFAPPTKGAADKPTKPPPARTIADDELAELDEESAAGGARKPAAKAPRPSAPPASTGGSPRSKSSHWKSAPPPAVGAAGSPGDGLVPLSGAGPHADASAGLTPVAAAPGAASSTPPLTDLFSDPMVMPADPLAAPGAKDAQPRAKKKRNVWDSPLLLVGGGLLGVMIVAIGLLWYSLTRGTAAELVAQADGKYEEGAYTDAIALYERFLESYPRNPAVSHAKVRLHMAELRQTSGDGQNPRQGLTSAKRVLPMIEGEEKFDEARVELATLLPDIADGFATLAAEAKQTAEKEELVGQADEAMKLVNNAVYLPPSLRKERETRIAAILDKLKVAQRSIEQDKDLVIALEKISAAEKRGDAAGAYQVRASLLKVYPALAADAGLLAATRAVGERERSLVQVNPEVVAAATDDPRAGGSRLVLSYREGSGSPEPPTRFAYMLIEGAVYGLDADSGRALWRRHVGYETLVQPQPVSGDAAADAIVADARTHELLRLAAATGKVVWRQAVGQPFFAPAVAGERMYVTTQTGRVLQIDAQSGSITGSVQLPQQTTVAACFDPRQSRLAQPGLHSTLFVLSGKTLECTETFYLGHLSGAVLVPPVSILDHLIVAESPADDYTLLHVLAPEAESKRLAEVGKPLRLRGRIVMPLSVIGRRVVAGTDLGQLAVYEVDAGNAQQPVRMVAGLEPTERTPALGYYTADATRLWVAGRRCSMFEIQPAVQQLARKWSQYQDDAFVAPLLARGNVLVHTRRRPGLPGVVVTGCEGATGKPLWETHLAVPLAGLLAASSRKAVDAITMQGRVFPISSEQLKEGVADRPAHALPQGSHGSIWPELSLSADGQTVSWTETQGGGRAFIYDLASGAAPQSALLPSSGTAAKAAVLWGQNQLVPLVSGEVALLDPAGGQSPALPFQPQLSPDSMPTWTRPAVLWDGATAVIGDGRATLYRVAQKAQPKPHLAASSEQSVSLEIRGALVAVGDTIYGLTRTDTGHAVVAINAQTLALGAHWDLGSPPLFEMAAAGGLAFAASAADGLLCLEAGEKLRWKAPLAHGPLSGPPIATGSGELLLLHQDGTLARVNAETGEEMAQVNLGEPLGRAATVVGQQVFVSTSDGGVVLVRLPE
jgi:outer membrane protein assembly factor BamB